MNNIMPRPHLPYLQRETTRHGKAIWYVRLNRDTPRVRINGDYASDQFKAEYQAAIAGTPVRKVIAQVHKGSLRWLCDRWRESSDWYHTARSTQRQRENILLHILVANGHLPYVSLDEAAIMAGRERRMKTPFAANNYLKTMRALFGWAKTASHVTTNPAAEVGLLSRKTEGHEPWNAVDVLSYRNRWPLGTKQRLAMELLLWTGLRRGDAVRFGRQHIGQDGFGRLKSEKTGKVVPIAIAGYLKAVFEHGPVGDLAFIVSDRGLPYSKESFGTKFRTWCDAAGVSKSAHGLRKLAATEIAEGGGTEMELQAALGWSTIGQSSVYTRNAQQESLAKDAMSKRVGNNSIPAPFLPLPHPENNKAKSK